MKETAEEYLRRIEGYLGRDDPFAVLRSTPAALRRVIAGASSRRLAGRPAPEMWAPVEILAHLADVEIVIGCRVRSILGSPGLPIQVFDQDAWATAGHYEKRDSRKSLEQFRVLRGADLSLYKTLSPEQWKYHGVHPERGEESVERILFLVAGHDLNHLAQIETILEGNSKRGLP